MSSVCPACSARSQRALRKVVRPEAIARAALACQAGEVTSSASAALRMLAHSMKTLGMVDKLMPARSSRGWMPSTPSYELVGSPVPAANADSQIGAKNGQRGQ